MRNRVERLRLWLLAGAGLLVLVLAVFIGSARYLMHHFLAKLPPKLGANIKSEMNGFTYSQWDDVKRRTLYTIHAAKEVEHTDGKITLHDVSMVLYGAKGDRADRIYGDEFEYDPNAHVVHAIGVVHIDLQAAEAGGAGNKDARAAEGPGKTATGAHEAGAADDKIIHATTSGLVYMEKLGVAATSEPIEFHLGEMTGHAVGADYNSDSGVLMLHSAVNMSGIAGGRPVTLTAATADLDNRDQRAFLTHAKYVSLGQTAEAEQATLHTRPDNTLARVEAQGNVTLESDGATIVSARGDVLLNAQSQPESALLTGGILYTDDGPLRQARGQAQEADIAFDTQPKPQPKHAVFTGSVHMTERTRATEAPKEPWSVRDLIAAKVDAVLVAAGPGKTELRDADATGSAHLTVVNNGSLENAHGEGRSDLSADDLKAHLIGAGDPKQRPQIDTVAGRGHTMLRQLGADGIEQTSAGDVLDAKFRPAVSKAQPASAVAEKAAAGAVGSQTGSQAGSQTGRQASDTLLNAVQQGHIMMTRRVPAQTPAKPGSTPAGRANAADDVEHAVAERAVYDGDLDRMTLMGSVELTDSGSELWANQVALDHKTGDAQAQGAVKVNYVKDSSTPAGAAPAGPSPASVSRGAAAGSGAQSEAGPVHVLADRAEMKHATEVATFYGKPARMWQDGSQVQAPMLEFARAQRRLVARGEAAGGEAQVHTVLVSAGGDGLASAKPASGKPPPGKAATGKSGADKAIAGKPGAAVRPLQVVRVASRELIYSDTLRQAEFTGGVRVESADGTMLAREATVYLQAVGAPPAADAGANAGAKGAVVSPADAKSAVSPGTVPGLSLDGHIERVVATGQVEVEQPGRRATGERLVYTASDGLYVLTGDAGAPPKLVDSLRATTVTGAALRFYAGDESVEALGTVPGEKATGQRARTDTQMQNEKKTGNAKH